MHSLRNPFDGDNWSWSGISVGIASQGSIPERIVADSISKSKADADIMDDSGNRPFFDRIWISEHQDMASDAIRIGASFEDVVQSENDMAEKHPAASGR